MRQEDREQLDVADQERKRHMGLRFYLRERNGSIETVSVDLSFADASQRAFRARFPFAVCRTIVRTPQRETMLKENWLELVTYYVNEAEAFVGQIDDPQCTTLWFYAARPPSDSASELINSLGITGSTSKEDAAWSIYLYDFFPHDLSARLQVDNGLLYADRAGTAWTSTARHALSVPQEKSAAVQSLLGRIGLTDVAARLPADCAADVDIVGCMRVSESMLVPLNEMTFNLCRLADSIGGRYGGWDEIADAAS